jgi:cupin 2 domain-containing protein
LTAIVQRLLSALPDARKEEITRTLLTAPGLRLERIVSNGQASPEGFWYDQPEAEWVIVVSGSARISVEGTETGPVLETGDAIYLPPHCRHRVTWTSPDEPTVWLALFIESLETAVIADAEPIQGAIGDELKPNRGAYHPQSQPE